MTDAQDQGVKTFRPKPGGHVAPAQAARTPGRRSAAHAHYANVPPASRPMVYPHSANIERAVGRSFGGRALHDPASCAERNVEAFTDGDTTHFATDAPSLHVAAHEAAHVLQHSGSSNDARLGAEGHASAVADAAVAGRDASQLIGSAGSAVSDSVHNYTLVRNRDQSPGNYQAGMDLRVSEDGRAAVADGQTKHCFAELALILEADKILQSKGSGVKLSWLPDVLEGEAPDGSGTKRQLLRVQPELKMSDSGKNGDKQTLYADCGRSSREVMGPTTTNTFPVGLHRDASGKEHETTRRSSDPNDLLGDILINAGLGKTRQEARKAYEDLSAEDREKYDKRLGLNKYAQAGVGDAFTTVRHRDAKIDWDYHWAGVLMATGQDRVTLENVTEGKRMPISRKNDEWFFNMYGPSVTGAGSFHNENKGNLGGDSAITLTARNVTSKELMLIKAMTTLELIAKARTGNRRVRGLCLAELENRQVWVFVRAGSGSAKDKVLVKLSNKSGAVKADTKPLFSGTGHTFKMPLAKLLPLQDDIRVQVFDVNHMRHDEVVDFRFNHPYKPENHSGRYYVWIRMP